MNQRARTHDVVVDVAAAYQRAHVVPHCKVCTKPCCKLTDVVLELDWQRTRDLYGIGVSQRVFDRMLARGDGPAHIRAQGGTYYAHGTPCPAYVDGRCGVYDSTTKPEGCTDFPVYADGDALVVDRRCEAVDVDAVEAALRARLPTRSITRRPDPEFPEIVSFEIDEGRRSR